ncbi:MAG: hypothetical protein GY708_15215 [Actinomycetia bacterium]|nr:hypothetical protein [Actinomycetes bacterium]
MELSPDDHQYVRGFIEARTGIRVDPTKGYLIGYISLFDDFKAAARGLSTHFGTVRGSDVETTVDVGGMVDNEELLVVAASSESTAGNIGQLTSSIDDMTGAIRDIDRRKASGSDRPWHL